MPLLLPPPLLLLLLYPPATTSSASESVRLQHHVQPQQFRWFLCGEIELAPPHLVTEASGKNCSAASSEPYFDCDFWVVIRYKIFIGRGWWDWGGLERLERLEGKGCTTRPAVTAVIFSIAVGTTRTGRQEGRREGGGRSPGARVFGGKAKEGV